MLRETILPITGSSFAKKSFIMKHFSPDWHYHPEFEIVAITSGTGSRFVGNSVTPFSPGEIVLIGANVPHFHLSDSIYYENNDLYCSSEVIQFNASVFPMNYQQLPEFERINKLLEKSSRGLLFHDELLLTYIRNRLLEFELLDGLTRLVELYRILDMLSRTDNVSFLSIGEADNAYQELASNLPVYKAYQFLSNNFRSQITLDDVAKFAGQNPSSLCRNFKKSTGKSIFECLMAIRIDFAYKLLTNTYFNVIQIAYECGFNNISHFNHKFKELTGITPIEYRKRHKSHFK